MDAPAMRIRRGQRLDFDAVMRLLSPAAEPAADRRTIRRFRHIVADLGGDLYVAEIGGRVVGVIHASYARQLDGGQRAHIESLAADPEFAGRGVGRDLVEFIVARARKRACAAVSCVPATDDAGRAAEGAGLTAHGTHLHRRLDED